MAQARRSLLLALSLAAVAAALPARGQAPAPRPAAALVHHLVLDDDAIDPGTGAYLVRGIEGASRAGAAAVLIQLDTPGGLLTTTREVVKAELASPIPVIVWVGPGGARAGSAGVFLTVAAGVAAMAPETNIGAAHPVGLFGPSPIPPPGEDGKPALPTEEMERKVLNDTVAWVTALCEQRGRPVEWCKKAVTESEAVAASEALELGVVDLLAPDVDALLAAVDGRTAKVARGEVTLRTAGARVQRIEPLVKETVVHLLADPNVLFLLIALGLLGIFGELSHPGVTLPGVVGAFCLLAAAVGLAVVPFNVAGLLLLLLAFVLFVLEVYVTSFGLLTLAGVASLVLGGLLLFDTPEYPVGVEPGLLGVVAISIGALAALIALLVARAYGRPVATGQEGMVGLVGTATRDFEDDPAGPKGPVSVRGEYWSARCAEPVRAGERVRVRELRGLELLVERASAAEDPGAAGSPPSA